MSPPSTGPGSVVPRSTAGSRSACHPIPAWLGSVHGTSRRDPRPRAAGDLRGMWCRLARVVPAVCGRAGAGRSWAEATAGRPNSPAAGPTPGSRGGGIRRGGAYGTVGLQGRRPAGPAIGPRAAPRLRRQGGRSRRGRGPGPDALTRGRSTTARGRPGPSTRGPFIAPPTGPSPSSIWSPTTSGSLMFAERDACYRTSDHMLIIDIIVPIGLVRVYQACRIRPDLRP